MADIVKVTKGLVCHKNGLCQIDDKKSCPYWECEKDCSKNLMTDALELLKEKMPKSPTWRRGKAFCGGCGGCLENKEQHSSDIVSSIRFCKWCGTPVDWSNE